MKNRVLRMPHSIRILMAQLNAIVGDITHNTQAIIQAAQTARDQQQAQMIVFPELSLIGYPPEDLLLRPGLSQRVDHALLVIQQAVPELYVVVGYPARLNSLLYNMAGVFYQGEKIAEYQKQYLPNYQVFDEKRYFSAGNQACIFSLLGHKVALTICEDIWHPEPMAQAKALGAQLMININASPFSVGKEAQRRQVLAARAQAGEMPIVYVNRVGGQDELVFDGGSLVVNAQGECAFTAPCFEQGCYAVEFSFVGSQLIVSNAEKIRPPVEKWQSIYQSLVLGVKDYVEKNNIAGVLVGSSGGIDSALTLAIAVDALGKDRVHAVMMPFHYTADMSLQDAEALANNLGISHRVRPIEKAYDALLEILTEDFSGRAVDLTEENLQARIRGNILMALSNKLGYLVLTTGNKSEMAVGYATLYGDMCGGFAPLKDVLKTWVQALASYRNNLSPVIPQRIIDRPPSAELRPDQKDEDSLPPYEILDRILALYIEEDCDVEEIVAQGFAADVVAHVARLVDRNEYKRRQSAVGVRVTQRGFGRDRRYPICFRYQ